uniref:Kinesin-like protein n=1 Tax=Pelagomonas calceolata TaxID=35677 RepID=A0A7S3ZNH0_9STRA|mmetsp:Transcript_6020/g.17972  ORF Transcript_6020/g.17972 Transcript_6020/m.17972 type:complete len:588 (-) Transcript_6020:26-1789(-)
MAAPPDPVSPGSAAQTWKLLTVARIKPLQEGATASVIKADDSSVVVHRDPTEVADDDEEDAPGGTAAFALDKVCGPEAPQEEVYGLLKPVVTGATKGRNGCVFAYGQTGSGKTHTVVGGDSFRERGLVPRAISQIFRYASKRQPAKVSVSATFAQVYDDVLYDLLDPRNSGENVDDWVKARVLEDNGSLKFDGLAEYEAASEADALRLLWLGSERRKTGRTKANDLSSRSHAVFTLYVFDEEARTRAKLHLVDLAGSERFSYRTKDVASFESRNINLSLHHLEHVVRTLCETSPALSPRKHVPYRNSVLTSMLRDSLGGNCRTALVATLAADAEHARESAATLRFARRCGAVKAVAVQRNLDLDPGEQLVARLREENRTLRAALREADGALTKAADDADRALRRAAAAEAKARDLQQALDGPRGHRAASTSDSDAPPPRASAPSPSQPPPNPRDLLSRGAVVLKHGRTGLQSVQPRFAWVSAERVLRWRRLGDGGDGDGDASGSARLADYADVEAGGDVRRSRRSSMGGALDSCALTLIPAGEDRPLTLQFDAGSAAASTALRDDWLAALRAAVAAAQADDAASGTV